MDPNQPQLTWPWLVGIVAGSSGMFALVTAMLTKLADWASEGRKSRRAAAHTAMRASVILKDYAHKCAGALAAHLDEEWDEDSSPYGVRHSELPLFAGFPDDFEWMNVEPRLSYPALLLQGQVAEANQSIVLTYEGESPPDGEYLFRKHCSRLGLFAWNTAEQLTRSYGLPLLREKDLSWSYPSYLRLKAKEAQPWKGGPFVRRSVRNARRWWRRVSRKLQTRGEQES